MPGAFEYPDQLPPSGLLSVGRAQFGQQREENALDRVRQIMGLLSIGGAGIGASAPTMGIASRFAASAPSSAGDLMFSQLGSANWPLLAALGGITGVGGYGAYQVKQMMDERNRRLQELIDQAK